MNVRVIRLIAQAKERWPLAGDNLFVDLDLSIENLPPGQRLAVGNALIEVTAVPHIGCLKFAERYGRDRVSQIITYGTMAARAVVRDVGRVLGHPYGFVDRIAKLIPFEIGMTLRK